MSEQLKKLFIYCARIVFFRIFVAEFKPNQPKSILNTINLIIFLRSLLTIYLVSKLKQIIKTIS